MKRYLILFREPDGRREPHPEIEIQKHREDWKVWMARQKAQGLLIDGAPLAMTGCNIQTTQEGKQLFDGPYYVNGLEIVGGFLILKGENLEAVSKSVYSCPVFDFGGKAEIREVMEEPGMAE